MMILMRCCGMKMKNYMIVRHKIVSPDGNESIDTKVLNCLNIISIKGELIVSSNDTHICYAKDVLTIQPYTYFDMVKHVLHDSFNLDLKYITPGKYFINGKELMSLEIKQDKNNNHYFEVTSVQSKIKLDNIPLPEGLISIFTYRPMDNVNS